MPGPKQNNNRRYPEANHQPCHKAAERIGRALARQEAYDKLTLEEKVARLPPEPHAKKQRARLLAKLEKQNKPAQAKETTKTENSDVKQQPKKYMKGK